MVVLALAGAGLLVGTTACEGDSAILALAVKTDFVPGAEVTRVRTFTLCVGSPDRAVETAVANGDDHIELGCGPLTRVLRFLRGRCAGHRRGRLPGTRVRGGL